MSNPSTSGQTIQPYVFFDGRCEEAIEFYKKALGAEVGMIMRFKDAPAGGPGEGCAGATPAPDLIMHGSITIGGSTILVSDGRGGGQPKFEGFSLSYTVPNEAAADKVFTALTEGGKIEMPIAATFFSPRFGMVTDKFGVCWMVYMEGKKP